MVIIIINFHLFLRPASSWNHRREQGLYRTVYLCTLKSRHNSPQDLRISHLFLSLFRFLSCLFLFTHQLLFLFVCSQLGKCLRCRKWMLRVVKVHQFVYRLLMVSYVFLVQNNTCKYFKII